MKNTELSPLSYTKLSRHVICTGDTIREDEGQYFKSSSSKLKCLKHSKGGCTVLSCFKNRTERNCSEVIKYGSTKGKPESYNELLYSDESKKKENTQYLFFYIKYLFYGTF